MWGSPGTVTVVDTLSARVYVRKSNRNILPMREGISEGLRRFVAPTRKRNCPELGQLPAGLKCSLNSVLLLSGNARFHQDNIFSPDREIRI